jgi:hypothetical protein
MDRRRHALNAWPGIWPGSDWQAKATRSLGGMNLPRLYRRFRRWMRRILLLFCWPGAIIIDCGSAFFDRNDLVHGNNFWLLVLATSMVFWIVVWTALVTMSHLASLMEWLSGRILGKASVREPGRARESSFANSSAVYDRTVSSSGESLSLLRVELDLKHSLWSAAKAVLTGGFLMIYGIVIAISTVALTVLSYPIATILLLCAAIIAASLLES